MAVRTKIKLLQSPLRAPSPLSTPWRGLTPCVPLGSAPRLCSCWPQAGPVACPWDPSAMSPTPRGRSRALWLPPPQEGALLIRMGLLRAESLWGLRTCPGVIQGQSLDLAPAQLWPSRRLGCWPQPWRAGRAALAPRCVHNQRCEESPCCLRQPTPLLHRGFGRCIILLPVSSRAWLPVPAQELSYILPACPALHLLLSPFTLRGKQA